MLRIAIAGFQHETNSFAKGRADLAAFEMADSWPGLLTGQAVVAGTLGMNIPIAGFAGAATAEADLELHPILWCAAEPCGPVTDVAFDAITGRIVDGLRRAGPLDGIYLDLHGAMITETHVDGEGELLARIRAAVGAELPIAISLDMHAHVTPRMVALASSIAVFRTYPHLDMAETGARCLPRLKRHIAGWRPAKSLRRVPFLIPMHAQFTGAGPMRALYARVATIPGAELAAGFTGGDTPDTGPAVLAHADTQAEADEAAGALVQACLEAEAAFEGPPPPPAAVVREAMRAPDGAPVVIADVEDNPGGGGSSDTTGLLRALVAAGAQDAMLGVMHDPDAAATAHAAGAGAEITVDLGGRSGCSGDAPFAGRFRVEALSDGQVRYEGEMYGGGVAQIGPTALLRVLDTAAQVRIVVSSVRNQCLDRAFFRHLGLTPEAARIICVKSTVHHRADFDPIAQASLATRVPGALGSDMTEIPFRNLAEGLRLGPLGPAFSGPRQAWPKL